MINKFKFKMDKYERLNEIGKGKNFIAQTDFVFR